MKKTIIGIFFITAGLYTYLSIHRSAIIHMETITEWYTSLGKYGQSLVNTYSIIPFICSLALILAGFIILLFELRDSRTKV